MNFMGGRKLCLCSTLMGQVQLDSSGLDSAHVSTAQWTGSRCSSAINCCYVAQSVRAVTVLAWYQTLYWATEIQVAFTLFSSGTSNSTLSCHVYGDLPYYLPTKMKRLQLSLCFGGVCRRESTAPHILNLSTTYFLTYLLHGAESFLKS